ncbi:hypothetical protein V8017_21855 [Stenotrophomonas rhizophila]
MKRTVDGVKTQCTQSGTNSDVPQSKNVMSIASAASAEAMRFSLSRCC